jgi:hypothetical protein
MFTTPEEDAEWEAACAKARARMPKAKPLTPKHGEKVVVVYPKLYGLLGYTAAQKQELTR